MARRQGLGEVLVEEHLIAQEQLDQARRAAQRLGSPLVAVLLEQGLVREQDLVELLARRLGMRIFDPDTTPVDPEAVRVVPQEEALRFRLLPLQLYQVGGRRVLRVAMVDPLDVQAIEDLEFSTDTVVEPIVAPYSTVPDAIRTHYRGMVTQVIPRGQSGQLAGQGHAPVPPQPTLPPAQPFAGDLAGSNLETKPVERIRPDAAVEQCLEALVRLLVQKEIISTAEYAEEIETLLRHDEDED